MVVEIKKPITKEKVNEALSKITKQGKKKSLRKHFGKLKRGLGDGMIYQKNIRNEWV